MRDGRGAGNWSWKTCLRPGARGCLLPEVRLSGALKCGLSNYRESKERNQNPRAHGQPSSDFV